MLSIQISRIKFAIAIGIIIGVWMLCKMFININVAERTHKMQSDYEQKIYDIKNKLETEKIQLEKQLKTKIVDITIEKDKCKLELETQVKNKEYKELAKKNPAEFKKRVNSSLGVKERKK